MGSPIASNPLVEAFARQALVGAFAADLERVGAEHATIRLQGLSGSARALLLVAAVRKGAHLLVLENREQALYFAHDLEALGCKEEVFFYPDSSQKKLNKYNDVSAQVQRTAALSALAGIQPQERLFIVSYPQAVMQAVAPPQQLKKQSISLSIGDKISHEFLKEHLLEEGFERVEFVAEPGQFAVRGGIIDLFSYAENRPYRLSFFGDEVEDIRLFDCNSQRSIEKREQIILVPNLQELKEGEDGVSLLAFISDAAMLWLDGPQMGQLLAESGQQSLLERFSRCYFSGVGVEEAISHTFSFHTQPQPLFNKDFHLLAQTLQVKKAEGYAQFILSDSPSQIARLQEILASIGQEQTLFEPLGFSLHEGFTDSAAKVCVYTDHQIFDRFHRVKANRAVERSERITIQELSGFQIGDYIVHIDHGVGIFGGLVRTQINGKLQEVVKLIYKNNDVLFVNIHGLHRISKYKSGDAQAPKIYQLGTGAWQKLKQQTKSKVKDIARDLILLYAKRRSAQGFAFAPDGYLQHALEASFIYEDTPDQLKATQAVKQDMEQGCPMDRLVCGDVGFGKTEVAIRAAFKAATDGKQVAILVPTTILALQHYNTFKERLKEFPVKVAYICRLRNNQEIKETLTELEAGKVDMIIGTHRLLNKDVKFKSLGLLVVDEEQKFGVTAKERLRQMALSVDTLTLTATPIPRTLQFSLMGARDLSIINTPPPNRIPVHTEIQLFDEDLIRQAIMYERERGGQIFFVHNRVDDIKSVEELIRRICPGVRTCVGHGQMEPKALERVVLDFIEGDYDVLVSTTIVENGIDIPNANTMIINQAQNFGLSDLHQLRGRVGRSNRRAFCYLLVPPGPLNDDARRRLRAIEAFSELGSGFNIAMQDLDIRGAGNLLGGEQSGFMAEMGFETYQRVLNEAFLEIKEEQGLSANHSMLPKPVMISPSLCSESEFFLSDCTVDTDMELLIPDDYVSLTAEKIRLYKELDSITEEQSLQAFLDGLKDRFGSPPPMILQLAFVVRLRRLAMALGFERIVLKNGMMIVYFIQNPVSAYYSSPLFAKILQYIQRQQGCNVKEHNNKLSVTLQGIDSVEKAYEVIKRIKENA